MATIIHCHGAFDLPLSPPDLSPLFRSEFDLKAYPLAFAITPERKMLIFRGPRTPQWDEEEVVAKVAKWKHLLFERISRFLRPGMDFREREIINAKATHALVRSIVRKYNLKPYSCPTSENIVFPETA